MQSEAPKCKTIAIVSNRMPYQAPAGNLRYMYSLARFLETRGHRVEIVLRSPRVPFIVSRLGRYYPSGRVRVWARGIYRIGRLHFVADPFRIVKNVTNRLLSFLPAQLKASFRGHIFHLLTGYRHVAASGGGHSADTAQEEVNDRDRDRVVRILDRLNPDAIFFDTVFCAAYCHELRASGTRYVITHDVVHQRHETFLARGLKIGPRLVTREDEIGLLKNFEVIVAIQREERDVLRDMAPTAMSSRFPTRLKPCPVTTGSKCRAGVFSPAA